MIVRDLAIYLRDVRVHICALGNARQQPVQFQHTIHLKFSPDRGLTVEGWKGAYLWEHDLEDQYLTRLCGIITLDNTVRNYCALEKALLSYSHEGNIERCVPLACIQTASTSFVKAFTISKRN